MELTISDEKTKELLAEVLAEMMKEKREVFREIFLDAMEECGLAGAISESRKNEFVGEGKVMKILSARS